MDLAQHRQRGCQMFHDHVCGDQIETFIAEGDMFEVAHDHAACEHLVLAESNSIGGDVGHDYAIGSDDRTLSDSDAFQDMRVVSDPAVPANSHGTDVARIGWHMPRPKIGLTAVAVAVGNCNAVGNESMF